MDDQALIEQELFTLLRRTNAVHLTTAHGEVDLDRSTYGILCLLADQGPTRPGAIAAAFHLDPSTVTRQAQAAIRLGLAAKSPDPDDRRATLLRLTDEGQETIDTARAYRRRALAAILGEWTADERAEFARGLARFNATLAARQDGADAEAAPAS